MQLLGLLLPVWQIWSLLPLQHVPLQVLLSVDDRHLRIKALPQGLHPRRVLLGLGDSDLAAHRNRSAGGAHRHPVRGGPR